jgi:ABC-type Zn2+ transport system substrate-binding protein/surface adhesin
VIFKVEGDFYKPIKVIDTKRSDLNAGDSVVVKGSGFLRMIMAQLGSEKLENEDKEDHDDHKGHNEEHKDEHPEEAHHD